jgi:hypothetical protein
MSLQTLEKIDSEFIKYFNGKKLNKEKKLLQRQYTKHIQNFNWNLQWFIELEEIIIKLSYYPDFSVHDVKTVIREKIRSTTVFNFNEFILNQDNKKFPNSIRPLYTHYHLLLQHSSYFFELLSSNKSQDALFILNMFPDDINWSSLSSNENSEAIDLLEKYPDKINYSLLSKNKNPKAIKLLKKNFSKIDWYFLSGNPTTEAIHILKQNLDKVVWDVLSANTHNYAIRLLKKYMNRINWNVLSSNSNSMAIELLINNENKINYVNFSLNPNPKAVEFIQNKNKINWSLLSLNNSSKALDILENNMDKINWDWLCSNTHPRATKLLLQNPEKINWKYFSCCSNYGAMEHFLHLISSQTNPSMIHFDYLSGNSYDYYQEKINIFNQMPIFSRCKIKL